MFAWRLTRRAHSNDPFSGEGARRYGGRWNHVGTPVVYCSATLSLAALEFLVNLPISDLPDDLVSIQFHFPDSLKRTEVHVKDLPSSWRNSPAVEELKDVGTEWVRRAESAILAVPSAVIPAELNYLINPSHVDCKRISVDQVQPFALDPRLYRRKSVTPKVRSISRKK